MLEILRFKIVPTISGQKNKTATRTVKTRESPYFRHFHASLMCQPRIKVLSGISDRTELELTVECLKELSSTLSIRPVRHPWLPPLPPMLVSPLMEELCEGESGSRSGSREDRNISDLCFPLGLLDIPEEQLQKVYRPDLQKDGGILYFASAGFGKTTVLFSMIDQLLLSQRESDIALFDSKSLLLLPYRGRVRYIEGEEEALDLVDDVTELCTRRKSALEAALSKGEVKTPREFYENQRGCWLFIDDADDFMEKWKMQLLELFQMLVLASESGVGVVISIHAGKFRARNEFTAWLRSSSNGLLLGNPGAVGIFQPASSREYTAKGYGLLFRQGSYRKLLLPGAKLL